MTDREMMLIAGKSVPDYENMGFARTILFDALESALDSSARSTLSNALNYLLRMQGRCDGSGMIR